MFVKAGINMNDSMITSGLFELQDEVYSSNIFGLNGQCVCLFVEMIHTKNDR